MTNYNDGKWIGWNGGECPVHPKSRVEFYAVGNGMVHSADAENLNWHERRIIAFRVVKEHREPREWWVWQDMRGHLHFGSCQLPGSFKVREVLE